MRKLLFLAPLLLQPAWCQPTATVTGKVLNAITGAPLENVRLKLEGEGQTIYAQSDAHGRFQFTNLHPAQYSISAESAGFLLPGDRGSLSAAPTRIDLRLPADGGPMTGPDGMPHATVTIPMTPAGRISGKLNMPGGQPCVSCRVLVMQKIASPSARTVPDSGVIQMSLSESLNTDARGEFDAARLRPGDYYLGADQPRTGPRDPAVRLTYYPAMLGVDAAKPISIAGGQQIRADFTLLRIAGVHVTGRVVPPGAPDDWHAETDLALMPVRYLPALPANLVTSATGAEFEFGNVLPGKYMLVAQTRAAVSDAALGANQVIEVGATGLDKIEVRLQKLTNMAGALIFGPACASAPAEIAIMETSPLTLPLGRGSRAPVAPDGSFALHVTRPGRVRIDPVFLKNDFGLPDNQIVTTLNGRVLPDRTIDYPLPAGSTLKITVNCNSSGTRSQ